MARAGVDAAQCRAGGRAQSGATMWTERQVSLLLAALAGWALTLGGLVYLTQRHGFGAAGAWLPSLVHPFAFGLLTALALPATWRQAGCAAWGAVNGVFELGQHPSVGAPLAEALQAGLGGSAPVSLLADYFVLGSFDGRDLAAAVLGALAAAAVLRRLPTHQEPAHAC